MFSEMHSGQMPGRYKLQNSKFQFNIFFHREGKSNTDKVTQRGSRVLILGDIPSLTEGSPQQSELAGSSLRGRTD